MALQETIRVLEECDIGGKKRGSVSSAPHLISNAQSVGLFIIEDAIERFLIIFFLCWPVSLDEVQDFFKGKKKSCVDQELQAQLSELSM